MENIEKVYLENASRNQLVEELNKRESVTSIQINKVSIIEEKENTTTENNGVNQIKNLKSVLTNDNFGIIC